MTIFNKADQKSTRKLRMNLFDRLKKCPDVVSAEEPPMAEELRSVMSGNLYINENGSGYIFINHLTTYPPDPRVTCEAFYGRYFHMVSLEDLKNNTDWLKVESQYLYPMLVWTETDGKPQLVKVSPGSKKPLRLIKKASKDCLAYIICTAKPK